MTAKFNFLAARTQNRSSDTAKRLHIRRDGIGKIIAEVQCEHPDWTESKVELEAKIRWEQRHRRTA